MSAPLLAPTAARAGLAACRRLVVKVGSRSIVGAGDPAAAGERFTALAAQVAALRGAGRQAVIVSSGAVALGRARLGFDARPKTMAELQACAAVGQSRLMRGWEDALFAHGLSVGQMLLSHDDLEDRARYLNARASLDALLTLGAVPVINENDTVAVDEIRFGDNDQLAAMVSTLAGADLLVLLTDVAGLLDESGARVSLVTDAAEAARMTRPVALSAGDVGRGGMASKLDAARRAAQRGVPVVIADARAPNVLAAVLGGDDVGTLVTAHPTGLGSRKHWIAYTLRARGDLVLDAGAAEAIQAGGRSLLPAGIIGVRGAFEPGDAVVLRDPAGREVARGLSRYGTSDAALIAGAQSHQIRERLGYHGPDEVVHRDDLVVTATA